MRSGGLYCCALTTETRHVVQRRAVYNPSEIPMRRTSSTKVKILRLRLKDKHATAQRGKEASSARDPRQNRSSQERLPASVLDSPGAREAGDFCRECECHRARKHVKYSNDYQ